MMMMMIIIITILPINNNSVIYESAYSLTLQTWQILVRKKFTLSV